MHSLPSIPWWLYAAFLVCVLVFLGSLTLICAIVHHRESIKAMGWVLLITILLAGLIGAICTGGPIALFGGFA